MDRMKGRLSTRAWMGLLGALFLSLILAAALLSIPRGGRTLAKIYVDGELFRQIDLAHLDGETEFTIDVGGQKNVVRARRGAICMAEANCPDQVCVRQGWIEGGAAPIVCLPHRVVIQLEAGADSKIDAIAG